MIRSIVESSPKIDVSDDGTISIATSSSGSGRRNQSNSA
jgi:hypothetical protein